MQASIPTNWRRVKLGDYLSVLTDYHANGSYEKLKANVELLDTLNYAVMIRTKNFEQNDFQDDLKYITKSAYDFLQKSKVKPGDILMNKIANAGSIYYMPDLKRPVSLAMNLFLLRTKEDVHQKYVFYYLKTNEEYIKSFATGTAATTITKQAVREIQILLPPLSEQKAIAHILSTLDDKIELNREMNRTLEAMARAIFKSWFVDFDPVRAKMDGRQPAGMDAATAELFPSEFEESALGMIPKGWRVDSFDKIVHILSGGTPKTSVSEYWNGNILWFSVKDAPNKSDVFVIDTEKRITQLGVDKSATQILPKGTTIITARGTVGKLALVGVEMAMNQSCFGIKGKNGYTDLFIYYHLSSVITELQHKTHGSVFDTINRQTFTSVKAVLPSKEIAQAFDNVVNPLMDKLLINLFECRTLTSIRDTLLPKLLSGEIRVKEAEKLVETVA